MTVINSVWERIKVGLNSSWGKPKCEFVEIEEEKRE